MVLRSGQHARVLDSMYVLLDRTYEDCWSRAWGRAHKERILQQFIRNWAAFCMACEAYNIRSRCIEEFRMNNDTLHVRAAGDRNSG